MKILIAGEFRWKFYHESCAKALEDNGHVVLRFGWTDLFFNWIKGKAEPVYKSQLHRLQYGILCGPIVYKLNNDFIEQCVKERPDIIWLHMATAVRSKSIRKIKKKLPESKFVLYTHDNPFVRDAKLRVWRNFYKSIPLVDIRIAHRLSDFDGYARFDARVNFMMRSYFIPEEEFPIPIEPVPERFHCDFVFAGHFEDDGRAVYLEKLIDLGYKVNIFGGGWNDNKAALSLASPIREMLPIYPAVGPDYRYAINGAKVALSFHSTLNQDTYTTRSFQIPAMKTCMLSVYSDDLASLFSNKEIAFFRGMNDFVSKARELITNEALRNELSEAAYNAVFSGGHDIKSRMQYLIKKISEYEN